MMNRFAPEGEQRPTVTLLCVNCECALRVRGRLGFITGVLYETLHLCICNSSPISSSCFACMYFACINGGMEIVLVGSHPGLAKRKFRQAYAWSQRTILKYQVVNSSSWEVEQGAEWCVQPIQEHS